MPKISTILQRKHRKFTLSAIFEREYALLDANDGVRNEDIKVLTVEKERPYLAGCPCIKQRERSFFSLSLIRRVGPSQVEKELAGKR
jgi:hypothetical protein